MPHYFSWVIDDWLAGMGQPGCGLELVPEMLPHERRFLNWLLQSSTLKGDREAMARLVGIRAADPLQLDRRMLDLYKKFRDIWGVLERYREGLGPGSAPVDRFVLSTTRLADDLKFLQEKQVGAIVTLTENPLNADVVSGFDFEVLHVPVRDRHPPTLAQIQSFVGFTRKVMESGRRVVTHCLGGIGRTGTMLASYLVAEGMTAGQAIQELRRIRSESIETKDQEEAVRLYEENR